MTEELDYYLDERVKTGSSLILKYSSPLTQVPKLRIVDLGCGDGRAAQKMMDVLGVHGLSIDKLFAVDINPTLKGSDKVEVIKSDLNNLGLQLQDNSVHVIYSLETIEHLINPYIFVKEVHRMLVKNGIFVITTPNILAWYNRILFPLGSLPIHYEVTEAKNYGRLIAKDGATVGHVRVFSPRAFKELLRDNGFSILETKGLKFLYHKGKVNYGKFSTFDSFFSHFPSLASMFSIVASKEK
jgi:2-polyprenyl-3-methyl-5-hydroxy-6-metoxy-1,4-benzoquinol methylase